VDALCSRYLNALSSTRNAKENVLAVVEQGVRNFPLLLTSKGDIPVALDTILHGF
jgi:hypothetical protein